jgi:chromosome segregation ATPase
VADATAATDQALERQTIEASELSIKHDELAAKVTALTEDNARLNRELDEAQVKLRAATDEVATLKSDLEAKDEAARLSELASKRAEQVKNLQLFPEDYVSEKASAWARLSDEDWAERIDEWGKARPATAGDDKSKTETASAMTGSSGELTKDDTASDNKPPARRSVLGLSPGSTRSGESARQDSRFTWHGPRRSD